MGLYHRAWLAVVVAVLVAASASALVTYYLMSSNSGGGIGGKDYRSMLEDLVGKVRDLKGEGYDVLMAEYYILAAKQSWSEGDVEKAVTLLEKAKEELDNAKPLPEAPNPATDYEIVPNTVEVFRWVPTGWDFVPVGTVFVVTDEGYLEYPRNDPDWKLSCFILGAVGLDEDGNMFLYQGRLPMKPEEGPFRPRVYYGGKWVIPEMTFVGPLYYREGDGYVEVYEYDLSGEYLQTLTYRYKERLWIHTIERVRDGEKILEITAKAEGMPMWLGEWGKTFIIHGIYPKAKGIDLWAGFWDVGGMNATLRVSGREVRVKGFLIVDRASHKPHLEGGAGAPPGGAPLEFTCMVIYQRNLTIMITHSSNPSPLQPPATLQHQMRVNMPFGTILLLNFTIEDDGTLQPSKFRLYSYFGEGYINATGEVIVFWPPKWVSGQGTWWDSDAVFTWGRAFIRWRGVMVFDGKEYEINALGMGEFTRYSPNPQDDWGGTCPQNGDCWGRWGD